MATERRNLDEGDYESLKPSHNDQRESKYSHKIIKPTDERNMSVIWIKKQSTAFYVLGIIGLILLVVGLCLYLKSETTYGSEKEFNYTYCKDLAKVHTCYERVKKNKACSCVIEFELKEPIQGETFLYYKTPGLGTSDNYANSRDDNQLAGNLTSPLSLSCGDFRTNETGSPIYPCGEIADSYLQDIYSVYTRGDKMDYLPTSNVGLKGITKKDKLRYHNPSGDLKTALANFSKPKNWTINIWELDIDTENNGVENEKFMAWMNTELELKPALRFKQEGTYKDGIPVGNYSLKIIYERSSYVDQRFVFISSVRTVLNESNRIAGIVLMSIGCSMFFIFVVYIVKKKITG